MCLASVTKTVNKRWLKREGGYVVCWTCRDVYQVIGVTRTGWQAIYHSYLFKKGWNTSRKKKEIVAGYGQGTYVPHFHAFTSESAARSYRDFGCVGAAVVKCKTHLKYVTATGIQCDHRVLVTSKIWMPGYPNKE